MFGLGEHVIGVNNIHYADGIITEMVFNSYHKWIFKVDNQWFILEELHKC